MAAVQFRKQQADIINYKGGKVGVSAVPGSGKTFTLSHLAAKLVTRLARRGALDTEEVLIVTFANAAANSIKAKIAEILAAQPGMLPHVGYRVRTLHGLSHDIVRERPSLVGLAEDFQIVDERVSAKILDEVVSSWLRVRGGDLLQRYLHPEQESNLPRLLNHEDNFPALAYNIADQFIRQAKDRELAPNTLRSLIDSRPKDAPLLPLASFGMEIYEAYQRGLQMRGAVDFNDLVRMALAALNSDSHYLKRLQTRWRFILEDEAQDSSRMQEKLLRLLSSNTNWVRVGDPNQAINTTFTTANPIFLREFLEETGVKSFKLSQAGRSAPPIIDLANQLVRWTVNEHPTPELRAAFLAQDIQPVKADDPRANPVEGKVFVNYRPGEKVTPERELEMVVASLERWLPNNPDKTVAVLVPENSRGFKLAELLRERGLPFEELLRSTSATRDAASRLRLALEMIASPATLTGASKLATLYRDFWFKRHLGAESEPPEEFLQWRDGVVKALSNCRRIEGFLSPPIGISPLAVLELPTDLEDHYRVDLEDFRMMMSRWLSAVSLPIDQLSLTIGADLYSDPVDIALCYKIAQLLRGMAAADPSARLPQFVEELDKISKNQRKFLGFDDSEFGYAPPAGVVTVATMHAAKGLEWDRVYLLSVNNYSFPSAQSYDNYMSERYYIRDELNLESETLAQLESVLSGESYTEGKASAQARLDYAAERLRLLYVGITRAKEELTILWNMGRFWKTGPEREQQPALPMVILWNYLEGDKSQ